ncbi:MgtC/SapB family protein [Methylocaldum sp.]|uniref:MgtC/SapB family protein n=1 Tax=Methylocaldum sp. TaxID=1969727 RepID=UPI002D4F327E|nr:MgtC/SapB family protein [Methylocaldum sp.]HYE34968.1 MgtC/SapB family protein [Methylocaldum sp.]
MSDEYLEIAIRLGSAWTAGSLIGLERTFHGRPAGFRTHALVCLASALLMSLTSYQGQWLKDVPLETIQTDPTRMAAGIMTGIGFLGAGVIFKEKLTIRGLTTAASIWMTAALGILYGIGFYYPAILVTGAVVGTLAIFRLIEYWLPSQQYAQLKLRYSRESTPDESTVRSLIAQHKARIASMSYRLVESGKAFEYCMVICTYNQIHFSQLADRLRQETDLMEFRISPVGD